MRAHRYLSPATGAYGVGVHRAANRHPLQRFFGGYAGEAVMPADLCAHWAVVRTMIILHPGSEFHIFDSGTPALTGLTIANRGKKPLYIRLRPKSITISDRKLANYGVKKIHATQSR